MKDTTTQQPKPRASHSPRGLTTTERPDERRPYSAPKIRRTEVADLLEVLGPAQANYLGPFF